MLLNPQANVQRVGSQQILSDKIRGGQMEPERGPGAYADSFARYITKQYGARGNTRALDLYIYALWGQHRPLHLISNDKSSAVVDYLNGFRICDRWGKQEKRSQDGVPGSQRGDFTYMSLRLGGWDRRLVQDHGRLVPQLGRLGSASARGCGPCQGAARSVGVSVLDEGRPVDDLSAPFVVTGN